MQEIFIKNENIIVLKIPDRKGVGGGGESGTLGFIINILP